MTPPQSGYSQSPVLNLTKFLWIDAESACEYSLADCIGDRFLCQNNPLYLAVRRMFLGAGFHYSPEATRLFRDYTSVPLFVLPDMLRAGIVPYRDNYTTLAKVNEQAPDLEFEREVLVGFVQRNYLLHESSHLVSDHILARHLGTCDLAPKVVAVLSALLCEGYALSVERVACALVTDETHRLFFVMNSYVEPNPRIALLRECLHVFGPARLLMVGILTCFLLTARDRDLTDVEIEGICDALPFDIGNAAARALLRVAIRDGFSVGMSFRKNTTPLYFSYIHCADEFAGIRKLSFRSSDFLSLPLVKSAATLVQATPILGALTTFPNALPNAKAEVA